MLLLRWDPLLDGGNKNRKTLLIERILTDEDFNGFDRIYFLGKNAPRLLHGRDSHNACNR